MKFRACLWVSVVLLTLTVSYLSAQTQQTGQSGTGSTAGGATSAGSAGTNPTNPGNIGNNTGNSTLDRGNRGRLNTNPDSQFPSSRQQILMISGTVVLDDGSPPPMGAVIERECGGRKTRETSVSPNGSFGFQIGGRSTNNLLPDASDSGSGLSWDGTGTRASSMGFPDGMLNPATAIVGCELRAQLGGYRSSTIILTSNQSMGVMDVGTIVLYPAKRVTGTTVSVTSLAAPKEAQKALDRAEKAFQKKKFDEAEKNTLTALNVYPVFAAAWFQLGQVYVQSNRVEDAKRAYAKAMEADANFVNPYIELARLAAVDSKWGDTVRLTDRALELDPLDFPYGYYMNAVANYNLGHFDEAEKSARKLNQLDSLHRWPQIHLVMASILHRKHDFGGEAGQLRTYLKLVPDSTDGSEIRTRLAALEKGGTN